MAKPVVAVATCAATAGKQHASLHSTTNQKLDALVHEQKATNDLLRQLLLALQGVARLALWLVLDLLSQRVAVANSFSSPAWRTVCALVYMQVLRRNVLQPFCSQSHGIQLGSSGSRSGLRAAGIGRASRHCIAAVRGCARRAGWSRPGGSPQLRSGLRMPQRCSCCSGNGDAGAPAAPLAPMQRCGWRQPVIVETPAGPGAGRLEEYDNDLLDGLLSSAPEDCRLGVAWMVSVASHALAAQLGVQHMGCG